MKTYSVAFCSFILLLTQMSLFLSMKLGDDQAILNHNLILDEKSQINTTNSNNSESFDLDVKGPKESETKDKKPEEPLPGNSKENTNSNNPVVLDVDVKGPKESEIKDKTPEEPLPRNSTENRNSNTPVVDSQIIAPKENEIKDKIPEAPLPSNTTQNTNLPAQNDQSIPSIEKQEIAPATIIPPKIEQANKENNSTSIENSVTSTNDVNNVQTSNDEDQSTEISDQASDDGYVWNFKEKDLKLAKSNNLIKPTEIPEDDNPYPNSTDNCTNIQYLKEDSYVYKDQNEKSQRTWLLKKGQEFSSTNANAGWVAVTTKDGKKGFVREEVLTSNKP